MALAHQFPNPDSGIPDLVRSLASDSKRLMSDEVRLAKLELREGVATAKSGGKILAVAGGLGLAAVVAFTVFVATLIGRLAAGHMWVGTLIAGAIDLIVGVVLLRKGLGDFAEPAEALHEAQETLASR